MNRSKDKVRTGVALDLFIVREIDNMVSESVDLGVTRSEVINAVLHGFIKSDKAYNEKKEKVRDYIIRLRKGLLNVFFF
jgi:metal-responsive CopG/Arc/MetJ family transcriptional regulator